MRFKPFFAIFEKSQKSFDNVSKPDDLKEAMDGVSLGKDKDGFLYIHIGQDQNLIQHHIRFQNQKLNL